MSLLEINNLTAGYQRNDPIIEGISLKLEVNETLMLTGKNGAGKSTLIRAIINNVPYVSGEIIFEDKIIRNSKKALLTDEIINLGIGYFLQGGRVFSQLTVEENLKLVQNKSNKNNLDPYSELLDEFLVLKEYKNMKSTYLSLGLKHLLSFAMIILRNPKLLILDEPMAGLDEDNIPIFIKLIEKLKTSSEIGIILIEHRTEKINILVDHAVEIENGKIYILG